MLAFDLASYSFMPTASICFGSPFIIFLFKLLSPILLGTLIKPY